MYKNSIILKQVVAEKTLTKNVHICYIRVREGKIEKMNKEGKMSFSIFIFFYTLHFAYLNVNTKLKTLAPKAIEKSATEI